MATKKRSDQIGKLITEVEAQAKRLRAGIRKRAAALPKELKTMAARLRKAAAHAAAQVEKYAHEIRVELESNTAASRKAKSGARKRSRAAAT